jgi:hypothetical protein
MRATGARSDARGIRVLRGGIGSQLNDFFAVSDKIQGVINLKAYWEFGAQEPSGWVECVAYNRLFARAAERRRVNRSKALPGSRTQASALASKRAGSLSAAGTSASGRNRSTDCVSATGNLCRSNCLCKAEYRAIYFNLQNPTRAWLAGGRGEKGGCWS